jgi:hypothetical protein
MSCIYFYKLDMLFYLLLHYAKTNKMYYFTLISFILTMIKSWCTSVDEDVSTIIIIFGRHVLPPSHHRCTPVSFISLSPCKLYIFDPSISYFFRKSRIVDVASVTSHNLPPSYQYSPPTSKPTLLWRAFSVVRSRVEILESLSILGRGFPKASS